MVHKISMVLVMVGLLLAGCAGAEITKTRLALEPGDITKNTLILINPVDATRTVFQGDFSDDPPSVAAGRKLLHDTFAQKAVDKLYNKGLNADIYSEKALKSHPDAAIVDLDVKTFDAGSNAARAMVGFGAGASYLLTDAKIYKNREIIADFTIDANSGGRGGFTAIGSWLNNHIDDSVRILVNYLLSNAQ